MIVTHELEVIGSKARKKIKAMVDTGYAGFLCLPAKIAQDLGLEFVGVYEVELGDGQWVNQYVVNGRVLFLGKTQEIEIGLTNSETAQLGTGLMSDCRLTIDFPSNKVRLTRRDL